MINHKRKSIHCTLYTDLTYMQHHRIVHLEEIQNVKKVLSSLTSFHKMQKSTLKAINDYLIEFRSI